MCPVKTSKPEKRMVHRKRTSALFRYRTPCTSDAPDSIPAQQSTEAIAMRVFSDGDTSIRIRHGKNPVIKVAFEDGMFSATWRRNILGYSTLRDGLLEEVNQTLVFLWNEYAKSQDCMTAAAARLKNDLLEFFEEI